MKKGSDGGKLKKPEELPKAELPDEVNLEIKKLTSKLVNIINKAKKDISANCKELGMGEKAIDAMMEGKEVIDCVYCHTPNMYETFYNEKQKYTMYECSKCGKNYLKSDKEDST